MFPASARAATARARRPPCATLALQHEIISELHGKHSRKGLLKSGLTVTATCTSCHTAHRILPRTDPESTVNANNVPATCGRCHHGIEEQFENSIHAKRVSGYSQATSRLQ